MSELIFLVIFTEAETTDELVVNVREVTELYFDKPEDRPQVVRLQFVGDV